MTGGKKPAKKRDEEMKIEHAIHGLPGWNPGAKYDPKGTEIKAQSGRNQNPPIEKGVEIHDPRNG